MSKVTELIEALKDDSFFIREKAAYALGEIQDPRAVEPLIAALKDTEFHVRHAAVDALGFLPDLRSVEPLIATLGDTEFDVRSAAENALDVINPGWRDAKNRKESKPKVRFLKRGLLG